MKLFDNLLLALLLAVFPSCLSEYDFSSSEQLVRVNFSGPETGSKSSVCRDDSEIENISVFLYNGGQLFEEYYGESCSSAEFELSIGPTYHLYAVANCGKISAPLNESDLETLKVKQDANALPMVGESLLKINPYRIGQIFRVQMERLYAKYNLKLSDSLEKCSFEVTSVRICQAAEDVAAFASESVSETVSDGDYASEEDISLLNNGGTAAFYVPENRRGVLLVGNTDPLAKIPDNIGRDASKCTYLEVKGDWHSNGAVADITLNMFLGQNNCSDFNVIRNVENTIVLDLSDAGTVTPVTWKLEREMRFDPRGLSFLNSLAEIVQGGSWQEVPLEVKPADLPYFAQVSEDSYNCFEAKVENGKLFARTTYSGSDTPSAGLVVDSWDNAFRDSLRIVFKKRLYPFTGYSGSLPTGVGEYGYLDFPYASDDAPVLVEADGVDFTIGGVDAAGAVVEKQGTSGKTRFYYCPSLNRLYIVACQSGVNLKLSMNCGDAFGILSSTISNPVLKAYNTSVPESGGDKYMSIYRIWYSDIIHVRLADADGNILDLDRYVRPSVLGNDTSGKVPTLRNNICPEITVSMSPDKLAGNKVRTFKSDDKVRTDNNAVADVYVWGIKALSADGTDVKFNISSGGTAKSCFCTVKVLSSDL